ncbi:unnamed protein product, partial [marine sediment metagenome]
PEPMTKTLDSLDIYILLSLSTNPKMLTQAHKLLLLQEHQ